MMYPLIIIFMLLYYIRPHEWIPGVDSMRPVALTLAAGIFALLLKGLPFRIKEMLKTPHDWFMALFFIYTIYYSTSSGAAFGELKNRIVLYLLVVHGLTNIKELTSFCWWWCGLIVGIAVLAWLQQFGFDPTGAAEVTARMDHRLSLGTSLFNNPNALGHSIVPLVPVLYQLAFWRRPLFIKEVGAMMLAIPLHALVLTQSKGAYLAGGGTMFLGLLFGRAKWLQVLMLVLALQFGGQIIYSMPRMQVLHSAELKTKDEGIYGRWLAFVFGLEQYDNLKHGVGFGRFYLAMSQDNDLDFAKAAHCSYVEAGAELGKQGLFIWLGVLYCCLRTVIMAKCRTVEEERIRRLLFAVIIAYMASSWFTNITYRMTFFLQAGAVAVFHRHLQARDARDVLLEEQNSAGGAAAPPDALDEEMKAETLMREPDPEPLNIEGLNQPAPDPPKPRMKWRRLGLIDLGLTYVLLRLTHKTWAYIVFNM